MVAQSDDATEPWQHRQREGNAPRGDGQWRVDPAAAKFVVEVGEGDVLPGPETVVLGR